MSESKEVTLNSVPEFVSTPPSDFVWNGNSVYIDGNWINIMFEKLNKYLRYEFIQYKIHDRYIFINNGGVYRIDRDGNTILDLCVINSTIDIVDDIFTLRRAGLIYWYKVDSQSHFRATLVDSGEFYVINENEYITLNGDAIWRIVSTLHGITITNDLYIRNTKYINIDRANRLVYFALENETQVFNFDRCHLRTLPIVVRHVYDIYLFDADGVYTMFGTRLAAFASDDRPIYSHKPIDHKIPELLQPILWMFPMPLVRIVALYV